MSETFKALLLSQDDDGWGSAGHPEWGAFKLGKTNPNFSTSGLNATVGTDDDSSTQWQDWLEDEDANQAEEYAERDEYTQRLALMERAMDVLNERERDILTQRRLQDNPVTLEDLSGVYDVSRERIRQIEKNAINKLKKSMTA